MPHTLTPLILNTYDRIGGAAIAATRLLRGLNGIGISARMLVQEKFDEDPNVILPSRNRYRSAVPRLRTVLDQQPLRTLYPQRRPIPCSLNWLPDCYGSLVHNLRPDIVNLHWVNGGFLSISTIARIECPVVWTLHDMWPFTGICHYSNGCTGFTDRCRSCPVLLGRKRFDLSRWTWNRKQKAWSHLDLTLVSPSRWLARQARKSRLLGHAPVKVIPNGLDLNVFKPRAKSLVRDILGIDKDKKVICFGGAHALEDQRKGALHLSETLKSIKESAPASSWMLLVFGAAAPPSGWTFPLDTKYLGYIHDDLLLAQIYAASDVFVAPSTQENLANTVMESLSCGTPVVTFDIGGMGEMITHRQSGYLARALDIQDLAWGIRWVLESSSRLVELSHQARETAIRKFSAEQTAKRYLDLFEEILQQQCPSWAESPKQQRKNRALTEKSIHRHSNLQSRSVPSGLS
jgi:glycosyltransferase involved in cell wall biosynthesis